MITTHQPIYASSIPTLASLTGSRSSSNNWIKEINEALAVNGGGTQFAKYLSTEQKHQYTAFYDNVIAPRIVTQEQIESGLNDRGVSPMRYIDCTEELEAGVPVSMHVPLMHDPRLQAMFGTGEVYGFNININDLHTSDVYEEMYSRSSVTIDDDLLSVTEVKDGTLYYKETEEAVQYGWSVSSEDPDIKWEELVDVMLTREYFHSVLDTSRFDPTNYPAKRRKIRK